MGLGTGLGFRLGVDATASFAVEFRLEVLFFLGLGSKGSGVKDRECLRAKLYTLLDKSMSIWGAFMFILPWMREECSHVPWMLGKAINRLGSC